MTKEERKNQGGICTGIKMSALFSWLSSFTDSEQVILLSIALVTFADTDVSHRNGQKSNFSLSWTECH